MSCKQFKFFGNFKWVFRFDFIGANTFFLKIKKQFNKNHYFICQILTSES